MSQLPPTIELTPPTVDETPPTVDTTPPTVDQGAELTPQKIQDFFEAKKQPQKFMGVTGAAPSTPLSPEGKPLTMREWRAINLRPPEERSALGEAGAALVRGTMEIPPEIAKTFLTMSGAPDSARQDIEAIFPQGPQPSRNDTMGQIANLTGGFIPALAEGPLGFGVSSYNNIYDRTGNAGAALGGGIVAAGLGMIPTGQLADNAVLKPLLDKYGETAVRRFLIKRLEGAVSGATNVAIAGSTESIARAAGATPEDFGVLENFLAGQLGHEVMRLPRTLGELRGESLTKRLPQILAQQKLVSPEEAQLVGNDPKKLSAIAAARLGDQRVEIGPQGEITSTPDTISWQLQQQLDHNPVAIADARERVARGEPMPFVDQTRLAPLPAEVEAIVANLNKAKADLSAKFDQNDFTELGGPVRPRGLLVRDIDNQLQKLQAQPTRQNVQQAQAMLNLAPKVADVLEPIPERVSRASLTSKEILSPIDMKPVQKVSYPLTQSDAAGYFKSPTEIAKNPRVQLAVAKLQKTMMDSIVVLREKSDMTVGQKVTTFKALDALMQERMGKILSKDTTTAATKGRATRAVAQSGLSDPQKVAALRALDSAFENIARHTDNETARGMVDRLGEELKGAPAEARDVIAKLRDGTTDPWTDLVNKYAYEEYQRRLEKGTPGDEKTDYTNAERRLRKSLSEVALGKEKDRAVEVFRQLSPDAAKPFLEQLSRAKSPDEVRSTLAEAETARVVEQRAAEGRRILSVVGKLEKNRQREAMYKLINSLTSEAPARPREQVEAAAIKYKGETFKGTDHGDALNQAEKKFPGEKKEIVAAASTPVNYGFVTTRGKFLTTEEAQKLTKASSPTSPSVVGKPLEISTIESSPKEKTPKPESRIITSNSSDNTKNINTKLLQQKLDALSPDQHTAFHNELMDLNRQGKIEAGLYRRYLGFTEKADKAASEKEISKKPELGPIAKKYDWLLHTAKNVTKPLTTENWLWQKIAQFNPDSPTYKLLFSDMVNPMNRVLQNEADVFRHVSVAAKKLGFNYDTAVGRWKLGRYLTEPVNGEITRGEALNALLTSQDKNRQDIFEIGSEKNGRIYKIEEMLKGLSPKDVQFALDLRSFIPHNVVFEKAFSVFNLLHGYEPQYADQNYWPSQRDPTRTRPETDYNGFKNTFQRDVDPLMDRQQNVDTPYKARDVLGEFLRITKQLSLYGELGVPLYRANKAITSPEVKQAIISRHGQGDLTRLQLYLADLQGSVGLSPTPLSRLINKTITNATVAKIMTNVGSAAKQALHMFTMYADGTVSASALTKAIASGAAFDHSVDARMIKDSGLAYLRYHGHFLQDLTVLGQEGRQPSVFGLIQHYGLFMQQGVDRAVMRVAFKAAELTAKEQGLTGLAAREETTRLFNIVAGRDQPTSNPLYGGELETEAKRQPLLRGAFMFMREQNRIFNVISRRVSEANHNPTPENIRKAGKAILFGVVGNAIGLTIINSIRRAAFDKPTTVQDTRRDLSESTIGMFYLGAPAQALVDYFNDPQHRTQDQFLGPIPQLVKDAYTSITAIEQAHKAGEDTVRSGVHRGESRETQNVLRATDSGLSFMSGTLGLPLWALWYQGRGLYNWTQPQWRLMTEFEQERQQLMGEGREASPRFLELERVRKAIEKAHQSRAAGLATKAETQRVVQRELEKVVR